ncbi:MAG: prolipoprotein diacylglyceryl transferase [Eubacteriales bacterium]
MFPLNPFAIQNLFGIEGLNISWYGIIIASGIALGVLVAIREARRKGLRADLLFDFLIVALPLAIVCARIYYVAFEWPSYAGNIYKIIAIWQGGIAIYGAVIGGVLAAVIICRIKKFPLVRLLDITAPGLILGQAIGRWGNFMNQEAFGNLVSNPSAQFFPYAVFIQKLGEWHQATFFYESLWDIGVFMLLMLYRKKAKYDGNVIAMYFISYGIGRFFIEGMRTDSLYVLPGIRISQVLSLILIAGGLIYILLRRKKGEENKLYHGQYNIT